MWKDIKGYEGIYQAHADGRLRSLDRYREFPSIKGIPQKRFYKGVVLTGGSDKDGYIIGVFHNKDGVRKNYRFHRLVAQTFIPNPENKPQVNHKDGIKTNNAVSNLEWATASEDSIHAFKTGLRNVDSMKIPVARLDKDTLEVLQIYESAQATKAEGYNRGHVGGCCRGDYGRHIHKGYRWKFVHDLQSSTTIESTSKDGSE